MRSLSPRALGVAVLLVLLGGGIAPAAHAAGAASAASAGAAAKKASASSAGRTPVPPLTGEGRALAAARSSGHPVAVPGDETATDTVTANPDGTLTLTQATAPVRALSGGKWKNLDPTLHRAAGGGLAPAVTTSGLALSGGGTTPMAVLRAVGVAMAISFPVALPAPTVSGSTAVYPDVLPGVDLRVTADAQGSVSDVLVVKDAAAAASPKLRKLVLAVRAPGLTLAAGKAGDITAVNGGGHVAFATPTPFMWDSAAAPAGTPAVVNPANGTRVDAHTGMPLQSSASAPGVGARVVPVGTAVRDGSIVLTPDHSMLTSAKTTFPVYIDPTFVPASGGSTRNAWTTINNGFPNQSYWKTSGDLQVGDNAWDSPFFTARSYVNMPVPSKIYGSTIVSAELDMTEVWSPSCTKTPVVAYLSGAISSSTTWNNQPSQNGEQDSQTVAHGHDSSCATAGVGFDVASSMQSAADGKWTQATYELKAGDESDPYGWKQFANTASLSVKYDHGPNTPAGLSTSPVTSCSRATIVGDGDVKLHVPVSDPDGGTLGVTLQMWKVVSGSNVNFAGTPTNPQTFYIASGNSVTFTAHKADLEAAAGGVVTEFYWRAEATDFSKTSGWSGTCNFRFDATRPGAPGVDVSGLGTVTIGQQVNIPVTPPQSGTIPTSYEYQLNAGPPGNVAANPDGTATIMVTPTRFANVVTVTSLSPSGNYGDRAVSDTFYATPGTAQADGDLTGDSIADLVTSGGSGMPSGLWIASGRGDGLVDTQATDFGANGNGTKGDYSPSDFNNSQVITGHFSGSQFQDTLAYYPTGVDSAGDDAGEANILLGTGDGSANNGTGDTGGTGGDSGGNGNDVTEQTISAGTFVDWNGDNPVQLANAGDTQGAGYPYPDLIGISGDSIDGWYLEYYPDQDGFGNYQQTIPLGNATPSGGTDWNNWRIATAQVPAGTTSVAPGTALYLWDPSTGALYLWTGLGYDAVNGVVTYASQYTIANGTTTWNKGAALTLHAADIDGDGTPDVWATSASGVTTAYLATAATSTATLATQPTQTLLAASHTWPLDDSQANPAATTAADVSGTTALPLTGSGGWSWNNGDAFDPDVALDGSSGAMATASAAADPNSGGITVSAWANPAVLGGTVLSQDMSNVASFRLSSTTAGTWQFCLAESNAASPAWDCATGGSALIGQWAQLTATYDPVTTVVNLYEGTVNIGHTAHAKLSGITNGAFQVGDFKNGASRTGWFNGQVSQVETWNRVVSPTEISSPSGYFHPETPTRILDTRSGSALGGNSTRVIQVTGTGGVPSSGVIAVAMNVAILSPTANGILTVYPHQTQMPANSDLNYTSGQSALANFKIVPPGPDGKIAIYNASSGSTGLLIDVTGYFTADPAAAGASTFTPINPTRILNTTSGAQLATNATMAVQVGGANGIPSGITAVALNVEGLNSTADGYLEYYPDGLSPRPTESGVQFHPGSATAETEIVPVAANGKIDIFTDATTDVVADVEGYFTGNTVGKVFHAIGGTRIIDSRQHGGPLANGGVLTVSAGTTVVAQNPSLVVNYTVVGGSAAGWISGYADGTSRGTGSILDYAASRTIDDLAITPSTAGTIDIFNSGGGGSTQVIVDCSGYFSAS